MELSTPCFESCLARRIFAFRHLQFEISDPASPFFVAAKLAEGTP
jgi:hypothetical protein